MLENVTCRAAVKGTKLPFRSAQNLFSRPLQRAECKSQLLGNNDWAIVCFAGYEGRRSPFPSGHAVTLATTPMDFFKLLRVRKLHHWTTWTHSKYFLSEQDEACIIVYSKWISSTKVGNLVITLFNPFNPIGAYMSPLQVC